MRLVVSLYYRYTLNLDVIILYCIQCFLSRQVHPPDLCHPGPCHLLQILKVCVFFPVFPLSKLPLISNPHHSPATVLDTARRGDCHNLEQALSTPFQFRKACSCNRSRRYGRKILGTTEQEMENKWNSLRLKPVDGESGGNRRAKVLFSSTSSQAFFSHLMFRPIHLCTFFVLFRLSRTLERLIYSTRNSNSSRSSNPTDFLHFLCP